MERISPPPRWPLDPVPGIVKLIIWAAKINAPRTPMRGIFPSSRSCLIFDEHREMRVAVTVHRTPPVTGDINASAICIIE
jgi:hypothetical protein